MAPIRVTVGRVGRAHGIRGEVAVDVRTDEPERRFAAGSVLTTDSRTLTVAGNRWHSGRLLVSFVEVADRTSAETLGGSLLEAEVDPSEAPAGADEYYDRHLIGLSVRDHLGTAVGAVTSVVHHGEQDTLVVATADGSEVLVPFVAELVPTVDVPNGYLVVADRPGLLDPTEAG